MIIFCIFIICLFFIQTYTYLNKLEKREAEILSKTKLILNLENKIQLQEKLIKKSIENCNCNKKFNPDIQYEVESMINNIDDLIMRIDKNE